MYLFICVPFLRNTQPFHVYCILYEYYLTQGTTLGKVRIAQLYAEFLYSIGAVPRRCFAKTDGYRYPTDSDSTVRVGAASFPGHTH
jgi:hypothetical protein